jgi:hypothetical protein
MAEDPGFGPVADRYSIQEGIRDEVLCDYRVLVVGIEDPRAEPTLLDIGDIEREHVVAQSLVSDAQLEGRRVFTFHKGVAAAERFVVQVRLAARERAAQFPALLAHSGRDSVTARARGLAQLAQHGGLIASPRIYLEGTDIPAVDTVVFVDPKSSGIEITQAIGRALRADPRDPAKIARIIVPVLVPKGVPAQLVVASSEFAPVWRVLETLATQDGRLATELARWQRATARYEVGSSSVDDPNATSEALAQGAPLGEAEAGPTGFLHDLGEWARGLPISLSGQVIAWELAVALRAVENVGDQRARNIARLEAFSQRTGTLQMDERVVLPNGDSLRAHRDRLLRLYRLGRLPDDLRQRLDALPDWVDLAGPPSLLAECWPALVAYEAQHGDSLVKPYYVSPDGFPLGRKVSALRRKYREGKLAQSEVVQCESLVGWSWNAERVPLVVEVRPLLRAFVANYGTAQVPAPDMWPLPRTPRDVLQVVADVRAAFAAGTLPQADAEAIAREFKLPWIAPPLSPALRRRLPAQSAPTEARRRALDALWEE